MLGGKIVGEGVDGCVLSEPMWPCSNETLKSGPSSTDSKYVSKIVKIEDEETENLKMAAKILGSDLSSRYLAGIQGECSPADTLHKPSDRNANSMKSTERAVLSWSKKGQACGDLKNKIAKGKDISKTSKIMIIPKYDATVSGWITTVQTPYKSVIRDVEKAIPQFMVVLQKLYQGSQDQLIHIDLHTGNIFVRQTPFEFGLADFGRCVFRRNGEDPSKTFYGEYLIDYISRGEFFCGFAQVPFEARLLNYCYRKNLDNATPSSVVKGWENDSTVRMSAAGSTDLIEVNRSSRISYLLKKVLFISMIEHIQSICKKIRANPTDYSALYSAFNTNEKIVVDFILTRYSILSPLNTICEEIMNRYNETMFDEQGNGTNVLIKFLELAILTPYDQDGSSLTRALSSVRAADMRVLWSDAGKS